MDTHRRESLTRKHLAERRRRAKINYYLDEIEALISPPGVQVNAVKMEKAELLEKTVAYLKHIQSTVAAQNITQQYRYQQTTHRPSQTTPLSQLGFTSFQPRPQLPAYSQQVDPLNLKTSSSTDDSSTQAKITCQTGVNSDTKRSRSLAILEPDTCGVRDTKRSRSSAILESDMCDVPCSLDFSDIRNDACTVYKDGNFKDDCESVVVSSVVVKKEIQTEGFMETKDCEKQRDMSVWRPWTQRL